MTTDSTQLGDSDTPDDLWGEGDDLTMLELAARRLRRAQKAEAERDRLREELDRLRANTDRDPSSVYYEARIYREALTEIAHRAVFERNPDGVDQAAATMQLIAQEALAHVEQ